MTSRKGNGPGRLVHSLARVVGARDDELAPALWAFGYFFCLLAGYYVIRPLRDEMAVQGGVDQIQWLFTGTFLVMLAAVPVFGALTARYPRRQFLPAVYLFFIANMVLFWLLFTMGSGAASTARVFFVWTSVFNLFVVSVFWSLMADLFDREQAGRLFAFIAAGGSAGAIAGPVMTTTLVSVVGTANLLLITAALFCVALFCMSRVVRCETSMTSTNAEPLSHEPLGGTVLEGLWLVLKSPYLLGICVLMLLTTSIATFLYFQQARIIADAFTDSTERTAVFAAIDLVVNVTALALQLFGTGRLVRRMGLPPAIALIPVLMVVAFLSLGAAPVLAVLVGAQIVRRGGNYGIMRPCREMLYTVVDRRAKYKAKNFIDTVVYRGGDAVSGWVYAGLAALGLGVGQTALVAAPVAAVWALVAWRLGKTQAAMQPATAVPGRHADAGQPGS